MSLETGVIGDCGPPRGYWESNSDPLEERLVQKSIHNESVIGNNRERAVFQRHPPLSRPLPP